MPGPEKDVIKVFVLGNAQHDSLAASLKGDGFAVVCSEDAKRILAYSPDLVLFSSGRDGPLSAELKNILRIHPAPVICIGMPSAEELEEIDDYCLPPPDHEYLAFKIRSLARRVKKERDINPLTGLPGNRLINAFLERAYSSGNRTVIYIDINDFKPYNDTYGFAKGDAVIQSLGKVISEAVSRRSADSFAGHIGGDDFIVVCPDRESEGVSKEVIDAFTEGRKAFYSSKDLSRGLIIALDRDGQRRNFPLLSLSVVSFRVSKEHFRSAGEISRRAMYLKKKAKTGASPQGSSIYLRDGEEHGMADTRRLEALAASTGLPMALRRSLIEALGESGDHSYFPLLTGLLNGSEPAMIRKSAAYALGRLKDPNAVPALIGLLADPNPHLRTRAAEALGEIGRNEAYGPVRERAGDRNRFVRQKVMESLGRLANEDSRAVLEKALDDRDPAVAAAAIRSLGELRTPASVPLLRKYLHDDDPLLRKAAVAALGRICHPSSAVLLCDCLDDRDPSVQLEALSSIPGFIERGFLEERRGFILARLLSFAGVEHFRTKRAAINAMGALKERGAVPALCRALADRNDLLRWSAALALGRIGGKGTVPRLIALLKDADDIVRSAAAWALGESGSEQAVEYLRLSLKDGSARVRESAASSIMKIVLANHAGG